MQELGLIEAMFQVRSLDSSKCLVLAVRWRKELLVKKKYIYNKQGSRRKDKHLWPAAEGNTNNKVLTHLKNC